MRSPPWTPPPPRARARTGRSRRRASRCRALPGHRSARSTTKPDLTPVSEADQAVERAIRDTLAAATDHAVLGEEFGDRVGADAEYRWIIDPIDGTKNYVRGVPIWATLIGLEHAGELVVGVVSAPALGHAVVGRPRDRRVPRRRRDPRVGGRGARRRAALVRVGHVGAVRRAAASAPRLLELSHRCWRTRGIGDFWQHMLVAEGAFDIAIDPIVSLWDVAALVPIVEEAGGRWSTVDGRADADGESFVCTNGRAARRRARRAQPVASARMSEITVGIDIGTSSVKAVAADADGNVVARSRIPHEFYVPSPLRFEHDAAEAWHDGPQRALEALGRRRAARGLGRGDGAVADGGRRRRCPVHAGPAVRRRARPQRRTWRRSPRPASSCSSCAGRRAATRRARLLDGASRREPRAHAAKRSSRRRSRRPRARCSTGRGGTTELVEAAAHASSRCRRSACRVSPLAEVRGSTGCVLEGGTIDAMGEQIVAGADDDGDVLVDLRHHADRVGRDAAIRSRFRDHYAIPHTAPGQVPRSAVRATRAGCSSTGSTACSRAHRARRRRRHACPVWVPYPRGERVPFQDPTRRAQLVDLDLTHGGAAIRRAAFEASGFVDAAHHRRVADTARAASSPTGGGTRVAGGSRRSPTARVCRCTCAQCPKAARWVPRSSRGSRPARDEHRDAPRWARIRPRRRSRSRRGSKRATCDRYARFLEIAG